MNKEQMGIDPKIKKEINEEGFEENAAVLIGKKEEMPQLLERLENEGRAENLGTYIKMHKEIMLPKEEMSQELREKIKSGSVLFYEGSVIRYVDKDGNIARVEIDEKKISSITGVRGIQEQVKDELEKFGFLLPGKTESMSILETEKILAKTTKEIQKYRGKIEKQIREKKAEEFDF